MVSAGGIRPKELEMGSAVGGGGQEAGACTPGGPELVPFGFAQTSSKQHRRCVKTCVELWVLFLASRQAMPLTPRIKDLCPRWGFLSSVRRICAVRNHSDNRPQVAGPRHMLLPSC
jgi:hypothetical protein